jgi:hypothetical protein
MKKKLVPPPQERSMTCAPTDQLRGVRGGVVVTRGDNNPSDQPRPGG